MHVSLLHMHFQFCKGYRAESELVKYDRYMYFTMMEAVEYFPEAYP